MVVVKGEMPYHVKGRGIVRKGNVRGNMSGGEYVQEEISGFQYNDVC